MIDHQQDIQPALVLECWNSWVRVLFSETGEIRWVNLDETEFEPLEPEGSGSEPDSATGRTASGSTASSGRLSP